MNVKLLRRIQQEIRKEPRRFDMERFFGLDDWLSPCGTTACIAGWALVLNNADKKRIRINADIFPIEADKANIKAWNIRAHATRILGLTDNQAERLFYTSSWPQPFGNRYDNAGTRKEQAKVALSYINYFIKKNWKV